MSERKNITIYPGQFIVSSSPAVITTVLGSCVSVCLWDKEQKVGGMNHFLLPGTGAASTKDAGDANRGIASTSMLVHALLRRNCKLENLEAKVFGGCNSLYPDNDLFKVGIRNIEAALLVLSQFGIPVVARHIGGAKGRKIKFDISTGKVRMILLDKIPSYNEASNKSPDH